MMPRTCAAVGARAAGRRVAGAVAGRRCAWRGVASSAHAAAAAVTYCMRLMEVTVEIRRVGRGVETGLARARSRTTIYAPGRAKEKALVWANPLRRLSDAR